MSILCDKEIEELAQKHEMITPFWSEQIRELNGKRLVSFGLSSFGYDARLDVSFTSADFGDVDTIDPKHPRARTWSEHHHRDAFALPPHGFILGSTIERFKMPDDVVAICLGKSTYARCGLIVNVTPLEPGWEGHVTLELSNTTNRHVVIYPGEGIAQFMFFRGERPRVTYADRRGKYQGQQQGPQIARV